jgi:hypothetical protein
MEKILLGRSSSRFLTVRVREVARMDLPGSGIADPLFQPTRARLFAELVDGKR